MNFHETEFKKKKHPLAEIMKTPVFIHFIFQPYN